MAEALISVLLEKLASVTYQYVGEEVKLVLNAEKDVQEFEAKLKAIRAVLEDAELRQVKEKSVGKWLEDLTDVSYKMDNVLDEWNTEILKQQVEKQEEHGGSTSLVTKKKMKAVCFSIPSSCFSFGQVRRVIRHHDIALEMKRLNEDLDEIAKQRERYNFRFTERAISEQPERVETDSSVDESIIFGREQQKEVLVSKLSNESSREERGLLVIPIVGMGGMGKTTLAQLAFNDENVKACFDIKIWICVSDPFDVNKIAKAIISGAKGVIPNSNTLEDLFQCMSEVIKGKKFLLVLDDVWTPDSKRWEKLELRLMQSGARGSRILVTTRKQEVVDMMGAPAHTIYLERLSEQYCLSIFNYMAFLNREKDSVLGDIGEKISKKCEGLPLAAKTLGSLMRDKKTRKEWQEVLNSKIWELDDVEEQVFKPLLLSYFDLVPMVKQCLLYCAIFPKDHEIDKDHLIELWMSQDYLYSKGKIEKKIIGQRSFDNLVMRSFFQDFEKDHDGNIWMCKMHDIVHDFLQFLTQNECFTMEVKGGNDTIESLGDKIRHLTLLLAPEGPFPHVSFSNCKTDLRTLATFGSKFTVVDSTLMSQLKHLRTLNLSGNSIEELTEEIGGLVHLRFLDLSYSRGLKKLPNGVCNLYNLQTLRLNWCGKLESLPQSMGKLINLKHLYVEGCDELKYLPKGIGRLTNLRRLDRCPVGGGKDDDEAFKLGDLRNLDQLQGELWIEIVGDVKVAAGEHEKASPLGNKQQLSELSIEECGTAEILNFLRPHPNLEYLRIKGYNGSTAPNWIMSLNNLRVLDLAWWKECEVLPPLGILPSLERLIVMGMKGVKKVGVEFLGIEKETSSASSCISLFPKLKTLKLWYMEAWEEWKGVEEWKEEDSHITIMPCLSSLDIIDCSQLTTLPDFLRKTPLQILHIIHCGNLARGCQKGRGKEWPKISHIPNIYIDFERIVEAEDAVELPERPSTSDSDDEGEGIVEAEEAV
ncbi:putative disease resistance protein RGA3 [Malus sylvestris]|uniref:putative disease resistance protein RGA3 n=1 Tax=Malus sylvestris TaxID=3752 RepID=UPI0021ACA1C3|nr:putative disease resistance protein RGA3 [Malus sylvestris]XP_050159595.1 putative disease resistance protein RGA3 [Malus sylvestris]